MASGWTITLQCKSRAFEDVYQPNPKNLIPSSSCRSSYRSIKDVVETSKNYKQKLLPRSGSKPETDLGYPPARLRRSSSTWTLIELPEGHPSRNVVEISFHSSWSPESFTGSIEIVFKVQSWPRIVTRFEEYRETVKSWPGLGSGCSGSGDEENARCVADGNEVMRFRCLDPRNYIMGPAYHVSRGPIQ